MKKLGTMLGGALLTFGLLTGSAPAAPLISEIYFNAPGNDAAAAGGLEYIELFDCPGNGDLDDYYLIFLENENNEDNTGDPGTIDNIFNLSDMSVGTNGFLVIAMRNTLFPAINNTNLPFQVAAPAIPSAPTKAESLKILPNGANVYVNRDSGNGYGSGSTSSIGHTASEGNLEIEGGGFSALLIKVDTANGGLAPVLGDDLDLDNDGFDVAGGQAGWTIVDSIGVVGEISETPHSRLYSQVGFGPGALGGGLSPGGVEPGAEYVDTSAQLLELEYVERVGMGTGAENWLAANLTDNAASGYTAAARNYGISGNHGGLNDPEVYVGFTAQPAGYPYGFDLTTTFGYNDALYCVVPEPSSVVLLGLGGLVVGLIARRRRA